MFIQLILKTKNLASLQFVSQSFKTENGYNMIGFL